MPPPQQTHASITSNKLPRSVIAILTVSLTLKCILLVPAHWTDPMADSAEYVDLASTLAKRNKFAGVRAPAYPAILAGSFHLAKLLGLPLPPDKKLGHRIPPQPDDAKPWAALDLARFLQVIVSTLTVFLLYRLTLFFFDRRTATASAAIFAFYPTFVGYSHYLWSETIFLPMILGGLYTANRAATERSKAAAFACGLILGLAALTRQIGLVVVVVAAAWIWIDIQSGNTGVTRHRTTLATFRSSATHRASLISLAVFLGAGAVVLPWTTRNYARHGEFLLISASGGVGLLFGATDRPLAEIDRFKDKNLRLQPLKRDRLCAQRAREIIQEDPLGWIRRGFTHNLPSLFEPAFGGVIAHFLPKEKGYGYAPAWIMRSTLVLLVASYLFLALTSAIGVWLAGERRFTLFFVAFLVAYLASHTFILGVPRHRIPIEAMAMPFAGFIITRRRDELATRISAKRGLGIVLSLVLFFALVSMSNTYRVGQYWELAPRLEEKARLGVH